MIGLGAVGRFETATVKDISQPGMIQSQPGMWSNIEVIAEAEYL